MIRKKLKYLVVPFLLVCFFSCQTESPCEDANGVQVNLGFFHFNGTELKDTSLSSLSVYASINDTLPYLKGSYKEIALPLSMLSDTSLYVLKVGTKGSDTIEFIYSQYTKLVSHACGFVNFYNLKEVKTTNHLIDSIWISKELVEFGDEENVKIYF